MNWGGSWTPNPGNSHIASTSCPSLYLSFSSPRLSPLEIGPLNTAKGLGSAVSSPSGVWGRVPTESEFGTF